MPSKKRTKNIPIQTEPASHYELHIEHTPHGIPTLKPAHVVFAPNNAEHSGSKTHHPKPASPLSRKLWNFLEWFATSALIFVILFFIMNFGSYAELIKSKFEKLTGNFQLSPYIQEMLGQQPQTQELLPTTAPNQSAKQIPAITMSVTPPDDRIIIPRINKNVPIIPVSTENLIRRDWNALEADIQGALQGGVVHYPGTAYPGDRGNVVITGHSSYFPWDPGRFKDVFALLHEVNTGDRLIVYHEQQKYNYEVYETKIVNPDEIQVLTQQGGDRLTLITCTPVGTNLRRLIVLARPV